MQIDLPSVPRSRRQRTLAPNRRHRHHHHGRTFRRQRTAAPIADLNLTNLIDLGFTLLIIFMIATPLIQQEQTIRSTCPRGKTRSAKGAHRDPLPGHRHRPQRTVLLRPARVTYKELETLVAGLGVLKDPPVIRIAPTSRCSINKWSA